MPRSRRKNEGKERDIQERTIRVERVLYDRVNEKIDASSGRFASFNDLVTFLLASYADGEIQLPARSL